VTAVRRTPVLAWLALAACTATRTPTNTEATPGVVFTHSVAEGSGDLVDPDGVGALRPRPSAAPAPSTPPANPPPDPEALRIAEQWEYELEWKQGALNVLRVTPRVFPQPVVTARRMGRFAIELWIGPELVERVRFDFPMLALEDDPSAPARPATPSLSKGAHVTTRVLVPAAARARRAVIVDRATETRTALAWPPAPLAPK